MRKLSMEELGRLSPESFKVSEKLPVVVVLDNIRSLHNVGSVFRTADAFRVKELYLCGITGRPPHRDIHKTALGSTESVDWKYFDSTLDAIDSLQAEGFSIVAVEQTDKSISLNQLKMDKPMALIFGNEVDGISQQVIENCDLGVEVPQAGTKHSLNVAVCAGIVIWHLFQANLSKL